MTTEEVSPQQSVYSTLEEQNELYNLRAMKNSYEKEFARYKQDCRKRALDLAHSELSRIIIERPHPLQPTTNTKPNPEEVVRVADKYYNWLISIPQ